MFKEGKYSVATPMIKGVLYATIASLVLILILAFAEQMIGLGGTTIQAVTQVIKIVSIFYGVGIAIRHVEKRGWLHGMVLGLLYTVTAFFLFSVLSREFDITQGLMYDVLFATIIGALCAVIFRMGTNRNI